MKPFRFPVLALVALALAAGLQKSLDAAQDAGTDVTTASVWDGVYTEAQSKRGAEIYEGACARCHGTRLNGAASNPDMPSSPPLARAKFLRKWDGRSLRELFEVSSTTMPEDNPDLLTPEEHIDVIAYMLSVSGVPAGGEELFLDLDVLGRMVINQEHPGHS